jgi:hypothetical protein
MDDQLDSTNFVVLHPLEPSGNGFQTSLQNLNAVWLMITISLNLLHPREKEIVP